MPKTPIKSQKSQKIRKILPPALAPCYPCYPQCGELRCGEHLQCTLHHPQATTIIPKRNQAGHYTEKATAHYSEKKPTTIHRPQATNPSSVNCTGGTPHSAAPQGEIGAQGGPGPKKKIPRGRPKWPKNGRKIPPQGPRGPRGHF